MRAPLLPWDHSPRLTIECTLSITFPAHFLASPAHVRRRVLDGVRRELESAPELVSGAEVVCYVERTHITANGDTYTDNRADNGA